MYDGERADLRALAQLENVLRDVGEELALWRARALKAEADSPRGGGQSRRGSELESENRQLRQRVEAAKTRVQELLARLTFLEEQARESAGAVGGAGSGGSAAK